MTLRDGKQLRRRENIMPDEPVPDADIKRKFFRNAEMVMSKTRTEEIIALENELNIRGVVELLGAH